MVVDCDTPVMATTLLYIRIRTIELAECPDSYTPANYIIHVRLY